MEVEVEGYHIIASRYKGPYTVVYQAVREEDDCPVILKVFRSDTGSTRIAGQYRHEFELLSEIDSDVIIKAHSLHRDQLGYTLVLEDTQGISLKEVMIEELLDLEEKLNIALEIVESIRIIHDKGIIHKDINPSNIVYNRVTKQVKLIDFGIASKLKREYSDAKPPRSLEGTLPYLAPEQSGRMNRGIDYRSDFYSLGVTLYELFTHSLPFEFDDDLQLIHAHLAADPLPPIDKTPNLPKAISDIVLKLLAKAAEDRYQGCWGIKVDLGKCLKLLSAGQKEIDFVVGQEDVPDEFQLPQKLYGRQQEINQILALFDYVSQGHKALLLVGGHSGSGKTSLIKEVYKPLTKDRGYFISGKYDQYNNATPYSAFASAFTQLVQQLLYQDADKVTHIKEKLASALGENVQLLIEVIPSLRMLVPRGDEPTKLRGEESKNRFFLAFKNLIRVFASGGYPIVLFLDDLQWADIASLELLNTLVEDTQLQSLFLIGSYRSNEVTASHPLSTNLSKLKKTTIKFAAIELTPLGLPNVLQLLEDGLRKKGPEVESLAALVFEKTAGNPFFVGELLRGLNQRQALVFDPKVGEWTWDVDSIKGSDISDNVADHIKGRLKQCSEALQSFLGYAACLGNSFDSTFLASATETPLSKVAEFCMQGVQECLIIPLRDAMQIVEGGGESLQHCMHQGEKIEFRFSHDRIQQTAYTLIEKAKKHDFHYRVGQLMLARLEAGESGSSCFELIYHFDHCKQRLTANEHRKFIEYNLEAAEKAQDSVSYQKAMGFVNTVEVLLQDDDSSEYFKPKYAALFRKLELLYLLGFFNEMPPYFDWLEAHAQNDLERVGIYKIRLFAYGAEGLKKESVQAGLAALKLLGIDIPEHPSKTYLMACYFKLRFKLARYTVTDLRNLPVLEDKNMQEALGFISLLATNAFWCSKFLLPVMGMKGIEISLKYGNCEHSPIAYSLYGLFQSTGLEKYDDGYAFSKLAIDISEIYHTKEYLALIYIFTYFLGFPWKEPFRNQAPVLYKAHQIALENGDLEHSMTGYTCYIFVRFFIGVNLDILKEDCEEILGLMRETKQELMISLPLAIRETIENFRVPSATPATLEGEYFQESVILKKLVETNDYSGAVGVYNYKLILACVFGDKEALPICLEGHDKYLSGCVASVRISYYHCYAALARLMLMDTVPANTRKLFLKKLVWHKKKLKLYAETCPDDKAHRYYLILAEEAVFRGDRLEAADKFEKSIQLAHTCQLIQEQALAAERAGIYFLRIDHSNTAAAYLWQARQCYAKWGAKAKLIQMNALYGELLSSFSLSSMEGNVSSARQGRTYVGECETAPGASTSVVGVENIDLNYAIRACNVLSGEVDGEKLLTRLMDLVIESAGAKKVQLFLIVDEAPLLHASIRLGESLQYNINRSFELVDDTPATLIRTVCNTQQHLHLDNACKHEQFGLDRYFRKNEIRSALGIPLKRAAELVGILYVEHAQSSGVFTKEKIVTLEMLAAQAAISIENTRLYDSLSQSESRFRSLFENATEGICQTTQRGEINLSNPALVKMLGYDSEEALVEAGVSLWGLGATQTERDAITELLDNENQCVDYECQLSGVDQRLFDALLTVRSVKDAHGQVSWYEGVVKDVTERKKSSQLALEKERAEAAAEAKSSFLANMSHEIRTPMSGVIGIADLLKETQLDSIQRNYLNLIQSSGQSLLNIINDILDFSKIDAGKLALESIEFNLEELASEVMELFSIRCAEKQIDCFSFYTKGVPSVIQGDPTRIKQILLNFISNAFKFTDQGNIALDVSCGDSEDGVNSTVRFEVRDTGTGISEQNQRKLFQSYSQAESSTARKFGGTGLGLAISKRLVELMQGRIGVKSVLGEGTTFWFEIPLSEIPLSEKTKMAAQFDASASQIVKRLIKKKPKFIFYSNEDFYGNALAHESEAYGLDFQRYTEMEDLESTLSSISCDEAPINLLLYVSALNQNALFSIKSLKKLLADHQQSKLCLFIPPTELLGNRTINQITPYYYDRPCSGLQFLRHCHHLVVGDQALPGEGDSHKATIFFEDMKVLVAEDNKVNQIVIGKLLSSLKAQHELAENGQLAFEAWRAQLNEEIYYELIFMDCQMPEMDGYTATKMIRDYEAKNNLNPVYIVALTAHASEENRERCIAAGMDDVVTKPVNKQNLVSIMKRLE